MSIRVENSLYSNYYNMLGIIRKLENITYKDISNLGTYLNNIKSVLKNGDTIYIRINIKSIRKIPLGYFYYHGFKIIYLKNNQNHIEIKLLKYKDTGKLKDKQYSILIKLPRTGKDGKRIYVYKLRTMQPYSEYLQDFMIEYNGLNSDGTIKNDFRITKFGKFARKYWIDELPMLINFFKGDLKFIGVRPLSDSMLSQYPKDHLRIRHITKPGLIPPYYIDKPRTFGEIIESERRYLKRYAKNPIKTDISYFFKFLKVVFLKGVRSS